MLKQGSNNFLACKDVIDGMYRCYTDYKYGGTMKDAPEYTKAFQHNFYNCLFNPVDSVDSCLHHFSDIVRAIYRTKDNKLCHYY